MWEVIGGFFIAAILISILIEYWYVVLIGFLVLTVISFVLGVISDSFSGTGGGSSGGSSGGGYSSTSSSSSYDTSSSSDEGCFYKGTMASGFVTGTYRDGRIFDGYNSGLSMSVIKASYSNGYVYDGSYTGMGGTVIGRYENGRLYKGNSTFSSDLVGTYKDGYIYPVNSNYNVIGRYDGNDEGGAAAAIYYLFYK